MQKSDTTPDSSRLTLSISAHKRRFKPKEQVKFDVMVTNSGKEPVYIFGTLDVGYSASLVVHVRNAAGEDVQPLFDDLTFESPDDKSAFVKLIPDHFLGIQFFAPADVLNMKPGRYSIYVAYQSPFSEFDVALSPFWGEERGTIKSNVLNVEVVR